MQKDTQSNTKASSYESPHAQSANVEIGLFLRFPWLPYIIGFVSILIIVIVFLFLYLRIQKKKKEIQDEEEIIISSRKSSGKDIHNTLLTIGTASTINSHREDIVSSIPISIPSRSRAHSSSHHPYFPKIPNSYMKSQNNTTKNHYPIQEDIIKSF